MVGAGFSSYEVLYTMTLYDVHLAVESLRWRNLELLQALRLNSLLTVLPWSKEQPDLQDLYSLPTDDDDGIARSDEGSIERAKKRVLEFQKMQEERLKNGI